MYRFTLQFITITSYISSLCSKMVNIYIYIYIPLSPSPGIPPLSPFLFHLLFFPHKDLELYSLSFTRIALYSPLPATFVSFLCIHCYFLCIYVCTQGLPLVAKELFFFIFAAFFFAAPQDGRTHLLCMCGWIVCTCIVHVWQHK